jgi:hypothetical protein
LDNPLSYFGFSGEWEKFPSKKNEQKFYIQLIIPIEKMPCINNSKPTTSDFNTCIECKKHSCEKCSFISFKDGEAYYICPTCADVSDSDSDWSISSLPMITIG